MEPSTKVTVVPIGPGGLLGCIFRRVVTVLTVGFVYPNSFVEGLDCTAIQRSTMGDLYVKTKKDPPKT